MELVDRAGHAGLELPPRLGRGSGSPRRQAATDSGSSSSTVKPAHGAHVDLAPALVGGRAGEPEQLGGLDRAGEVGGQPAVGDPVEERDERLGLLAPELGQRRVGLALQAVLGVPGRLAVADEQQAVGHRDSFSNSSVRTALRRRGQVERGARPSERSRRSARSHARHSRVRLRTARFHGACESRP